MTLNSMNPRRLRAALCAALLAVPAAALAHHGWSSYDSGKVIRYTGPLTKVSWGNPHAEATIDQGGKSWTVVLAPTSRLEARGITQAELKDGLVATLEGYPRQDGSPEMRVERITALGKTVEMR